MVLSKINPKISYPELKKIYPEDAKMEATLYEIQVKGVDIIIAVGNAQKEFANEDKGVIFYPIYLVKSNNTVTQIGVYEVLTSLQDKYIDEEDENAINVEKFDDPLIYNFVTREMLNSKRLVPEVDEEEEEKEKVEQQKKKQTEKDGEKEGSDDSDKDSDEEEEDDKEKSTEKEQDIKPQDIPDFRKDIFVLTEGVAVPPPLREETKQIAKDIREKYKEEPSHTWVQKFMKNQHFAIIDNEGGGDCLFATVRDAFSQIAQQTSVVKLRKKLADEANQETFMGYKELYDMYHTSLVKDTTDIKELAKEYQLTKEKFTQVLDRGEQKLLVDSAKKIKDQHDRLVKEKKVTNELLSELKFMKGVETLDKFQQKIKTCEFWGETWSISTMERTLNIKFILLSSEAYKAKDFNAVLQCGQLNDAILQNKGEFKPDYYIIVEYQGWHYKLISYKRRNIFTFKELPFYVKKLVVDKCMERNAGPFSLIPDFTKFKTDLYANVAPEEPKFEELSEAKLRGVYDDAVVFAFYAKSATKPLPGKGSGEKIPKEQVKDFAQLATIADWRRKLDDSWLQPFSLDNHNWASVEHYYQASKFKKNNQAFYLSFSLDSGTDLSKDAEMARSAGSKSGKHAKLLLRPKEVQVDPDFYGTRSEKEHGQAEMAKFTQNQELKELLLATKDAKLVHYVHAKEPELMEGLMILRDKIRKGV
jgi:predicted NAD-dependent protein-ADP-ribosyltransferase YbiA (DUF1768 family)